MLRKLVVRGICALLCLLLTMQIANAFKIINSTGDDFYEIKVSNPGPPQDVGTLPANETKKIPIDESYPFVIKLLATQDSISIIQTPYAPIYCYGSAYFSCENLTDQGVTITLKS